MENLPMAAGATDPPIASYAELLSPTSCHIRLSTKCQLGCEFCEMRAWDNGDKDREQDMDLATWATVRDKIMPSVQGIEICGLGEPTLSPLFPQICREVVAAGKVCYFPTNGLTLGSKPILACIGDTPRVSVSVDAGTEEVYNKVRPGGDWGKLWKSIAAFRKAKPNAFLHSQYTGSVANVDSFPAFVQLAADAKFDEVLFRFVHNHQQAREDMSLRFAKNQTEAAFAAAAKIADGAGLKLTIERRPYSETSPNGAGDSTPAARLKRYLDFPALGDSPCPPPCVTGTTNIIYTSTNYIPGVSGYYYTSDLDWLVVCGNCSTPVQVIHETADIVGGNANPYSQHTDGTFSCVNCTIYSTETHTVNGTICLTTYVTYANYQGGGSLTGHYWTADMLNDAYFEWPTSVYNGTTGHYTDFVSTNLCYIDSSSYVHILGTNCYSCPSSSGDGYPLTFWACDGTCSTQFESNITEEGVTVIVGTWCNGTALSLSNPLATPQPLGVFRTRTAPLGAKPEPLPEDIANKPVVFTPAAIVCFANGDLSTCFAKHIVANVMTPGFDWARDVLADPGYQRFLHARRDGKMDMQSNPLCGYCSATH